MMDITQQLIAQKESGQKAFVPYIVAGAHGLDALEETILNLQSLGATALEIGIPYSDPVADGPVIRTVGGRALQNGVTLSSVLETVARLSDRVRIPLFFMTYVNTIFVYGIERFAKRCSEVGIRGVIIPDLPFEERGLVQEAFRTYEIANVPLVALTSDEERMAAIVREAEGFIYAVTINGVTGRQVEASATADHFATLQRLTDLPIYAGFGITTAEDVDAMNAQADGVIVGTAIVRALEEGQSEAIEALFGAKSLK
ncbi:tryptophan synthase subunit alpha [Planococcaceae bacterium Storch 2/2-2]|nr:tryptophan synthase subunit alpha [Planococcaceae bacterium Storch 2/2-2]